MCPSAPGGSTGQQKTQREHVVLVGMPQQCKTMLWLWVRTGSWHRLRILLRASCRPRQKDKQKWETVAGATQAQLLL